ncbi:MAG: PDZ domain-containing protein [Acidobacteria bacterium]|nr:PDZ domain-containing protein [Acidobacteriota bacterium]
MIQQTRFHPRGVAHGIVRRALPPSQLAILSVAALASVFTVPRAQQVGQTPTAATATTSAAVATTRRRPQPARAQSARPPFGRRPAASAPQSPAPPVVAVVHRLSGWGLRAVVAPPDASFASTFDDKFVSTNIVAGYVLGDGRTVVARLPQPEADLLAFSASFPELRPPSSPEQSSLTLVRADGTQFDARFVGVDQSTGLSLFESSQALQTPSSEARVVPAVGQRVCVWAPLPAAAPAATAALPVAAARAETKPAPRRDDAPVGDEGVLYMNLGEIEGTLKEVRRSPSGRAIAVSFDSPQVSPEWAGGVALTEDGALIGIVEESGGRETTLLSAETVRAAAERVRVRRASVPQPWLGVRGDAVAATQPELFLQHGWSRQQAESLLRAKQGVVLTSVAPGSPAARAGLRAGDVVSRVGAHGVRGVEDMTWLLKELGGNAPTQFTILRGGNQLSLRVLLSEAQNPALETAQAELYAVEAQLLRAQSDAKSAEARSLELQSELRLLDEQEARNAPPHHDAALATRIETQRLALLGKLQAAQVSFRQLDESYARLRRQFEEAQARLRAASAARPSFAAKPLAAFGAVTAAFIKTNIINGVTKTDKGLVVVAVRAESPAAAAGLRVGDVVETVNGQPSLAFGWAAKPPTDANYEVTLGVLREGGKLALKLRPAPQH